MVALRLARAATGRNKIIVFAGSYHGSSDATIPGLGMLLGVTPGAIQDTIILEYGADASLQRIAEHGTALIFDEVMLGFRIHQGGCQAHFDIKADLATYGKIIGGGLPIGVVAG